ncbi:hypothetical protein BH10BAC4_BH10BAC4_21620 [soil metagenome]
MKKLLICITLALSCTWAVAQREVDDVARAKFMDRVYFGGGLGFSSGTGGLGRYTYIGLYPMIGYMVTNKFSVGATITYQYYNYPDYNQSLTQYGISPFVRYNFGQVFAYSEYMILSSPSLIPNESRHIYNRWLVGLGFTQPIGARGSINALAMYDVLWRAGDPLFSTPWVFRVFFAF